MDSKTIWTVVLVSLIVAGIVAFATVKITANVINVYPSAAKGYPVYTTSEVYNKSQVDMLVNSRVPNVAIVRAVNFINDSDFHYGTIDIERIVNGQWVTVCERRRAGMGCYIGDYNLSIEKVIANGGGAKIATFRLSGGSGIIVPTIRELEIGFRNYQMIYNATAYSPSDLSFMIYPTR